MTSKKQLKEITEKIIVKGGGVSAMAKALGESRALVSSWKTRGRIPHTKLLLIERLLGFKREDVRPDLKELFR